MRFSLTNPAVSAPCRVGTRSGALVDADVKMEPAAAAGTGGGDG